MKAPKPLPPPTMEERQRARDGAVALRKAIADPSTMGEQTNAHVDLCRPRRGEWWTMWANLPGFRRVNGSRYSHACLPGWTYARSEIKTELIPDLEALAERGVRPTEATSTGNAR